MSGETWIAGRFRLERILGKGAFGEAHLAYDQETDGQVVLKLLHSKHTKRPDLVERFRREIRALERVVHPCVPALVASGTDAEGRDWYAAEFCPGLDLFKTLRKDPGQWEIERAVHLADDLLGALGAAHAKGVIHRDLKPANIIIVEEAGAERIKLIDFGVAKLLGGGARTQIDLTQGQALGTPFYLSPEQADGSDIDARTDLYSTGVILFELLAGQRPFDGDTVQRIITAVLRKEPPAIRSIRPGVPKALEDLIQRLLKKDPADRPGSAREVKELLRAAVPYAFDLSGTSRKQRETAATMLPKHVLASAETGDVVIEPDPDDPFINKQVAGLYDLEQLLGKGGFGRVYRAKHRELGVDVALKLIPAGDPDDQPKVLAETYERFKREALAMRSFVHKHAVQVRNFGRDEALGVLFLELDYIEGETLDAVLKRDGVMPEERAVRIGRQVLSALAEAHQRGLVHRDLKPANIMLVQEQGQESARLLDFGIVKLVGALEDTTDLTGKGVAIGTVHFMSPEQAGGDVVDLPSDVYSMATVLYLMLAGQLPIGGGKHPTQASMRARIMTKPPRPLRELAPKVGKTTEAALMKALAKAPEDRFPDAAAFLGALGGQVVDPALDQTKPSHRVKTVEARGGPPVALVLVGLLLLAGLGVLATQPALRARLLGAATTTKTGEPGKTTKTEPPPAKTKTGTPPAKTTKTETPPAKTKTAEPPPAKTKTDEPPPAKTKTGEQPPPSKTGETPTPTPTKTVEPTPKPSPTPKPTQVTTPKPTPSPTQPPPTPTPTPKPSPTVNPDPDKDVPGWWKAMTPQQRPALPLPKGVAFGGERGLYLNQRDGSVLVYVAGDAKSPAFFIGRDEVTWAQWRKHGRTGPVRPDWAKDDHPAVNVSLEDARAYAQAVGAVLPTEAQWERAAGAGKYPWGDAPAAQAGEWRLNASSERDGHTKTAPIGSFPLGRSPVGCRDMAGNAAEWVRAGDTGVVKGGGHTTSLARCAVRAKPLKIQPTVRRSFVGLRIVRPVDAR